MGRGIKGRGYQREEKKKRVGRRGPKKKRKFSQKKKVRSAQSFSPGRRASTQGNLGGTSVTVGRWVANDVFRSRWMYRPWAVSCENLSFRGAMTTCSGSDLSIFLCIILCILAERKEQRLLCLILHLVDF